MRFDYHLWFKEVFNGGGIEGGQNAETIPTLYNNIYISTDEVEMYCYRSRDRYFLVTKPRNYSTTTEITMTKYTLSRKAISLGSIPKKWTF